MTLPKPSSLARGRGKLLKKFTEGWLSVIGLVSYTIIYVVITPAISSAYNVPLVYGCFIVVFISLIFNMVWYVARDASEDVNPPTYCQVEDVRSDNPALIFGLIYGFVASIAIIDALNTFNATQGTKDQNLDNIYNLIGFFSITIPFIHAGYVFLSTISAELMTPGLRKGQTKIRVRLFIIFLLSFIQAIFLWFTAKNLDNNAQFILLLTLAILVDVIWAVISMRISVREVVLEVLQQAQPRKQKVEAIKDQIPIEWLHLNTLTVGFLIVVLYVDPNLDYPYASFLMLCVLVFRTICDYILGWNSIYVRRLLKTDSTNQGL